MAVYDSRQINRMRQDAIRRSQEMHSRSVRSSPQLSGINDLPPLPTNMDVQEKNKAHTGGENPLKEIFEEIFGSGLDSDKLLIAALIYLLIKEKADIKLILALGYILL